MSQLDDEPTPPADRPVDAHGAGTIAGGPTSQQQRRQRRQRLTARLLRLRADCTDDRERRRLRDEVVLLNRSVAEAIASRYRNRGVPDEDLRQVAYEGLVKAVERFDASRDEDLLTYAVPTMRGEVRRYFRDLGWTVRPPRRVQENQYRLNRALVDLRQRLVREPEPGELATEVGLSRQDYDEAQAAYGAFTPASLDRPLTTDGAARGELLTADDRQDAADARVLVSAAMRRLSTRDRQIVYLRFWADLTQQEIGDRLGVTQMQVSRLISRILRDLRPLVDEVE